MYVKGVFMMRNESVKKVSWGGGYPFLDNSSSYKKIEGHYDEIGLYLESYSVWRRFSLSCFGKGREENE